MLLFTLFAYERNYWLEYSWLRDLKLSYNIQGGCWGDNF
jgi:hypothetical protein